MVSPLFFYQLVFFALIWFFVVLHLAWPKRPLPALATPPEPEPLQPTRHRSNEPKPFEGLTHKPHCALCECDTMAPHTPPPVPPDPMTPTNRRPREVDTSRHCCPHAGCDDRGWRGLGHLRANGHPSGGARRQRHRPPWHGCVVGTHDPPFHGTHADVARSVRLFPRPAHPHGTAPAPRWRP